MISTPLYQILTHALPDPANKTKFTLIFANLTEEDILLREEFDDLKKKYSDKFDVVYALDKPKEDWKGETGHLTGEVLKKYLAKPELGEKVKVFICGMYPHFFLSSLLCAVECERVCVCVCVY